MAKVKTLQQLEYDIQDLINIQATDGNWDYCEYMRGMANGLMVAKACITGEEPKYLDAPDQYISDTEILDKLAESGIILK